jgi:hypothetical protein
MAFCICYWITRCNASRSWYAVFPLLPPPPLLRTGKHRSEKLEEPLAQGWPCASVSCRDSRFANAHAHAIRNLRLDPQSALVVSSRPPPPSSPPLHETPRTNPVSVVLHAGSRVPHGSLQITMTGKCTWWCYSWTSLAPFHAGYRSSLWS